MRRFIIYTVFVVGIVSLVYFKARIQAASGVEITTNTTEHIIKFPFEKSFRFVATMKNNSNNTINIQISPTGDEPEEWFVLQAEHRYRLEPGEENNHIIVFEPGSKPQDGKEPQQKEEDYSFNFKFEWEGGSKDITVKVGTKYEEINQEKISNVKFNVTSINGQGISNYTVLATLPSGIEQYKENCSGNGTCSLELISGDYLQRVTSNYNIDHTSAGYYLQVAAKGYKSYFESDFVPAEGDSEKSVTLEPLTGVGEYELINTIESGFSIWWIKASSDEKYFVFTQGTHGSPDIESPSQTKVVMADSDGNKIWESTTGGECWGGDVSPNGEYAAAGCHDGKIYVWDKSGDLMWNYSDSTDGEESRTHIRWVKFSPDSKYLMSGPVNQTPEEQGLFEVETGDILWSFYTGAYMRESRFSSDGETVYLASGNGTLYAVDVDNGQKEWLGSGDYYIPFILGLSKSSGTIIASGKGRAFTALDLETGRQKWEVVIDQTITAGEVAQDGSVVGSSVGGMGYGLDEEGNIMWARQYGGVGHNAVYYTRNGNYSLFGGPNPTLFDKDGNVLWQREPDKQIEMTGPVGINTGAAYVTWMSEDAKLLIIGGDDGDIEFYKGEVKTGENNYSQLTGPMMSTENIYDESILPKDEEDQGANGLESLLKNVWVVGGIIISALGIIIIFIIIIVKGKRKKLSENKVKETEAM